MKKREWGRIQSHWMSRHSSGKGAALFEGGTWDSGTRARVMWLIPCHTVDSMLVCSRIRNHRWLAASSTATHSSGPLPLSQHGCSSLAVNVTRYWKENLYQTKKQSVNQSQETGDLLVYGPHKNCSVVLLHDESPTWHHPDCWGVPLQKLAHSSHHYVWEELRSQNNMI